LAACLLPGTRADRSERRLPYNWMQRAYVPAIRWATGHRWIALGIAVLFFAGSMALIPLLRVNLLDQSSSPQFPIAITLPENSTLADTDAETQKVEQLIRGLPGVTAYQATVGGISDPFAPPGTVPADPIRAQVLVLVGNGQYDTAIAAVKSAVRGYTGPAKIEVGQAENSSNASSSQMQVDVSASDPGALRDANASVMIALAKVHGVANLKSNLVASKPQYQLVPTDRLAASGLTVQQLALIVAQDVNGVVATQAVLPQGPVSVRVVLPPGTADTAASLAKIPIPTLAGVVPLSSLATIQLVNGPQAVSRLNGDRDATITGTITGNNTQAVQSDVSKALNGVALPSGVKISTGGVFQQLSTVLNQFALALLQAIALVYLIMVATFRSVIKPLVVLVSIAFAATGAIIGGLFTSTLLTLVLVPVLYSLTSRFTGPRTTQDLDLLLDAAEDRRFKPLGQRAMSEPAPVPLPALAPEPVVREFTVAMKIEPEDGTPGDPSVLERLRAAGYRLTFAEGSRR